MTIRVLSLGAGVQSSVALLMSCRGELPKLDAAIFADTQWEPKAVYDWLETVLQPAADTAGIPLHHVTAGSLRNNYLDPTKTHGSMPLFLLNPDGSHGMIRRQCTERMKIRPIRKKLTELRHGGPVEQWFGISLDEVHRMRTPDRPWLTYEYPLVERYMTRATCHQWLAERGYNKAPRSACIGCPYHSDNEWRHIKANPEEWADAVEFDRLIRNGANTSKNEPLRGQAFLHSARIPLDEVDLSTPEDHGQGNLFGAECAGVCGV